VENKILLNTFKLMIKAQRPNIVFILADDMGYGDMSAINNGQSKTPVLDSLINESIAFTHHYTASCVCNPSRAALLTGRYPHRTGSIDTLEWWGLERLALREITLAQLLKSIGYATGLVGKWHLGSFDRRYHPHSRGFDEVVCFLGGMQDYYKWRLEFNDHVVYGDGRYLTDIFTDEAVQFIERNQYKPFFLHVTYNAPHTPLQVPEQDLNIFLQTGKFNKGVSTVYGMIYRIDKGIGKILETLKKNHLEKNTIVIFTSDNGPDFGGQGENCLKRFNSQFNGAKGSVYEGGIRLPLLLRWPDGLPGIKKFDKMTHFCDWFPTLLACAGMEVPQGLKIDGVNLLPMLRGEGGKIPAKRFWQWNRFTPLVTCNAAMRDGDWKLVRPKIREAFHVPDIHWLDVSMYDYEYFADHGIFRPPYPPRQVPEPGLPELYNIKRDPLEKKNIADKHPEKVKKMLCELENWFEDVEKDRLSIK